MPTERVETYGLGGGKDNLISVESVEVPLTVHNRRLIGDNLPKALLSNATFLALKSPSPEDILAQVISLTQQINSFIRLSSNELSDVSDTHSSNLAATSVDGS